MWNVVGSIDGLRGVLQAVRLAAFGFSEATEPETAREASEDTA